MGPKKQQQSLVYEATKEYVDRAQVEEDEFPSFEINSKSPHTVILLLGADESEIVLRSLHHLDKFAKKLPDNAQKLYELQLVENIVKNKLYEHSELFIKRFALKLVAEVLQSTEAKFDNEVANDVLDLAKRFYIEDEDNFVIEYSALILLKITSEPKRSAALQEDVELIPNGLYKHIAYSDDPDILYNSYKIFLQILDEAISMEGICAIESFPFERVLGDINCRYFDIQKSALEILSHLALCKNDFFVSKYCCRPFFEEWFKLLEKPENSESLETAIKLCRLLMKNPRIARLFYMQYLPRFRVCLSSPEVFEEAIKVYFELSMYPDALEYIYSTGIVSRLRDCLSDTDKASYELCVTLVKLLNHPESFMVIRQADTVVNFLNIFKNFNKEWKTRGAASEALTVLCKRSLDACQVAVDHKISSTLAEIMSTKYGEIPSEVYMNTLNLLNVLGKDEETQENVMTLDLAEALIYAIKNSARSSVLMMNLFNTISVFSCNSVLRDSLGQDQFWETVLKYLQAQAVIVKNAVAEFVMHTASHQEFIDHYIDEGVLEHLLADDSALISCSNWSAAIESILAADLSIKFCAKGKLDLIDITSTNFFISKHNWKNIKDFRNMVNEEVSPRHTLFIVNYEYRRCSEIDVVNVPKVCSDEITPSSEIDCSYCRRPYDPYLPKYLEKAQHLLESLGLCDSPGVINTIDIAKISDRARILASIVNEEMCGTCPGVQAETCNSQTVSNHLSQLKHNLYCNIVPLGQVRFGGYFERAVLFKTLADKTGLPCTLQRGEDGKTLWNEIPIATPELASYCQNSSILPRRYLKPTHVVDLMDHPGELYPLQSRQAYEYLRLM